MFFLKFVFFYFPHLWIWWLTTSIPEKFINEKKAKFLIKNSSIPAMLNQYQDQKLQKQYFKHLHLFLIKNKLT